MTFLFWQTYKKKTFSELKLSFKAFAFSTLDMETIQPPTPHPHPPKIGNISTRLYSVNHITNNYNLNPFHERQCTLLRHCPVFWNGLILEKVSERSLPRCLLKFRDVLFQRFSITDIKPSHCYRQKPCRDGFCTALTLKLDFKEAVIISDYIYIKLNEGIIHK